MHTRHRLWETGRCGLVWGAVVLSVAGAASSAPGQTFIHGVDVSLWQGAIDWNSVKAAGNEYAFIRSTRGEGYKDPLFLANMRAATAAGLMVGPYHFCRLETNYLDPNDAVAEANHFLSVIKPYYDAGQMLPPVADVEGFPDFPNTATARAYVSAWTQTFSDTIYDALGVRPIVYGSLWTSNNYYTPAIASTHDLWLAWWKTSGMDNPPTAADTPAWGPWTFWQWTATGSVAGINGNVDRDLFNGDMLQLESLLHGQGPRGGLPGGYTVITDFDGADFDSPESHGIEGYFMNSPTYSGSTNGVVPATTTATRSTLHAQNGPASQR
ncbi:MAG TPA: glycoside hydrolase family 25 protein, partial [Lacipirellulaceae bacterium]|nr:glycoside hydrolase family 25 protein [Lacipirellulaceae bacterium]